MTDQHRARKRFGQNFLHDHGIINHIARSINANEQQHLVEIGPGKGALTQALLASGCHLDAIELDRDLVSMLTQQFADQPQFKLHQADALRFDFRQLHRQQPLRIVGNLPYNISTPLLFHLLQHHDIIHDMHFMLQLEVVQRLAATPGNKNYGRLSVMVQYYCQVEPLFEVPPGAFQPQPKVQSAVVRLTPHDTLPHPAQHIDTLEQVLRTAFGQRRKTLRNIMKHLLTADELTAIGIDPGARPETLTLAQFVRISNTIKPQD